MELATQKRNVQAKEAQVRDHALKDLGFAALVSSQYHGIFEVSLQNVPMGLISRHITQDLFEMPLY